MLKYFLKKRERLDGGSGVEQNECATSTTTTTTWQQNQSGILTQLSFDKFDKNANNFFFWFIRFLLWRLGSKGTHMFRYPMLKAQFHLVWVLSFILFEWWKSGSRNDCRHLRTSLTHVLFIKTWFVFGCDPYRLLHHHYPTFLDQTIFILKRLKQVESLRF